MLQLVSKTSTGKIKIVLYDCFWDDELHGFKITRKSGQFKGKVIEHPTLEIKKGKVNRTAQEQCNLEYNHLIKEKLDKGYKVWEKPLEDTTEQELNEFIGDIVVNQTGVPKPMLAKQADKVTNQKIYEKEWYASEKIDGLRVLIYKGNDGELHTASRGAMNYDPAMCEILSHPTLIQIFNDYPSIILDGEAYKKGLSLQDLNVVARTQVVATDYEVLQFYWYDIVDCKKVFSDRLSIINEIASKYNLVYDPDKEWKYGELRIQIVPHTLISGWDNIKKLHDTYVEDGWEGLVIRDPNKVYKPNGRSNDMIKIKNYQDDIFKVVGIEQGLRLYDDMVFVCELPDGRTFKAKPYGNHQRKVDYTENFDKLYKNHFAECKFFYYSDDGIPLQPNMKCFRLKEDLPND